MEAGLRAERNAKRAKAERLRTLQRMAKTHGMIARYREETEAAAAAAAAAARAVVERKWRLEATVLTDMVTRHGSHKDTTPSTHEAQLHLAYVRDERLACDARCGACERGELHSAAECALCEALTTPQERDPSTAWRRGHPMFRRDDVGDAATRGTDDDSAAGAARELLRARGQSEVNAWLERTSRVARERTSELSLTRKGLTLLHRFVPVRVPRRDVAEARAEQADAVAGPRAAHAAAGEAGGGSFSPCVFLVFSSEFSLESPVWRWAPPDSFFLGSSRATTASPRRRRRDLAADIDRGVTHACP